MPYLVKIGSNSLSLEVVLSLAFLYSLGDFSMQAFLHLFIQQTFTQHIVGGGLCNRHRAITVNKIFSLLLSWLLEEVALKH